MAALNHEQVRNIRAVNWTGVARQAVDDLADTVEGLELMVEGLQGAYILRTSELESRIEDKDASIQQLIEQLQKAEAQNAAPANQDQRPPDDIIKALRNA